MSLQDHLQTVNIVTFRLVVAAIETTCLRITEDAYCMCKIVMKPEVCREQKVADHDAKRDISDRLPSQLSKMAVAPSPFHDLYLGLWRCC